MLPFGESTVVTDMNVGVFYVTAVTAFVVVGILVSGWASNSKWALFGGIRGAAQVLSYEIPAGIALMVPVLMAGTLSMQGIVRAQGGAPWDWFVFSNPAAFVAFFIAVTSSLAEGNRTPFDLPEAESELVAGYHAEYSGFRLAIFLMVEWANMWIMARPGRDHVPRRLAGPGRHRRDVQERARHRAGSVADLVRLPGASMLVFIDQDLGAGVLLHLAALDPAPRARGSDDEPVLEVPGAGRVPLFHRDLAVADPGAAGWRDDHRDAFSRFSRSSCWSKFLVDTRRNIDRVKGDRVDLSNW